MDKGEFLVGDDADRVDGAEAGEFIAEHLCVERGVGVANKNDASGAGLDGGEELWGWWARWFAPADFEFVTVDGQVPDRGVLVEHLSRVRVHECDKGAVFVFEDLAAFYRALADVVENVLYGRVSRQVAQVNGPQRWLHDTGRSSKGRKVRGLRHHRKLGIHGLCGLRVVHRVWR